MKAQVLPALLAIAAGLCGGCATGDRERTAESSGGVDVAASAPDREDPPAFGPDGVPLDELSWSGWQYADCEAGRVELMLDQYCTVCHTNSFFWVPIDCLGDCNRRPDPVFFSNLIARGLVIPGDAERSRLVLRVRDSSMPPASAGVRPALSPEQIAALTSFIDRLDPATKKPECDPEASVSAVPPSTEAAPAP